MLRERVKAQADKQQRKASGASLQGSSSLTQWDRMCLCGVEVNAMLQLLAAVDEVGLLKGSCEQGSNDGTKVKTILSRSHDTSRLQHRAEVLLSLSN